MNQELNNQCQVCKSTEIAAGWRCTSCGRPICVACYEEFKAVEKRIECFNALCQRTNKLVPIDKVTKTSIPAVGVGTSLSSPAERYEAGIKSAASTTSTLAKKWQEAFKR